MPLALNISAVTDVVQLIPGDLNKIDLVQKVMEISDFYIEHLETKRMEGQNNG